MVWEIAEGSGEWTKITDAKANKYLSDHIKQMFGYVHENALNSLKEYLIRKNGKEIKGIGTTMTHTTYIRYVDGKKAEKKKGKK